MKRVLFFLAHNNAVPIALALLFLGAGASFAATNPEALYSAEHTALSVDNTYIAHKDLGSYSPRAIIERVTEDSDFYYVDYALSTIDVREYVWQDVVRKESMKVSKADLGAYRDLGVYVSGQLKQIIDRENARLAATKEEAQRNLSQKVVATTYGGLVGRFMDETTETLPGYTPVVVPPPPPVASAAASIPEANSPAPGGGDAPVSHSDIQILGNNPARIPLGARYADLGAFVPVGSDGLDIITFLNGRQVPAVDIDTSVAGTWTVRYETRAKDGSIAAAERIVIVGDPEEQAATSTPPISAEVASSSDTGAAELETATSSSL